MANVTDHITTPFRTISAVVPGTAVRFQLQVNALVAGQIIVLLVRLVTSVILARILLWSMNGILVNLHENSSGSGKVTVLLTTLEATVLVILPTVARQRVIRFKRVGTVTTAPFGQLAMLIVNVSLQLITRQK